MKQRRDKWLRWLDVIDKEIIKLVFYNHIFWEVQGIIDNNKEIQKPSAFYDYFLDNFIYYSSMSVRRQIKINDQSISFARLLKEISETPEVLSREWFISNYSDDAIRLKMADRDFDKFCGQGNAKDHIDPKKVKKDLMDLKDKAKKLEELADKTIAHRDISEPKSLPTFKELKVCIDLLDKLLCKYYLAFKAIATQTVLPTPQHDWKAVFNYSWLK